MKKHDHGQLSGYSNNSLTKLGKNNKKHKVLKDKKPRKLHDILSNDYTFSIKNDSILK